VRTIVGGGEVKMLKWVTGGLRWWQGYTKPGQALACRHATLQSVDTGSTISLCAANASMRAAMFGIDQHPMISILPRGYCRFFDHYHKLL
jgi:hypothetical protein